jgi:hypothetical protein
LRTRLSAPEVTTLLRLTGRTGWLVAATLVLSCASAHAQVTGAIQDPLAPPTDSDRKLPQQKFKPLAPRAQLGPPQSFERPASGAGTTGFDSTNARKRSAKTKPKKPADPKGEAKATAPAVTPLDTAPTPSTPAAQTPPRVPDAAQRALASGPPGLPPVALTQTYTRPKIRKRPAEDDPYAALGVRAGTFLLYPAIEFSVGRNTNPAQTPGGGAATMFTAAPELRVQSDWATHELKADLRGSYTGYSPDETPSLSRPYFNGKVDGRVDVSRNDRIDLNARAGLDRQSE